MSRIQVSELSKSFLMSTGSENRCLRVLDNLSLEIQSGEFVTLVGPSGCGKSTFLRILCGLAAPSSGSVRFCHSPESDAGIDIAYSPQSASLLPWMTVERNILLPVLLRRGRPESFKGRLHHLLDLVELREFAQVYPHQLSRGMAQRVALCRSLLLPPKVMVLDEPFASVDSLARETLDLLLHRVWLDQPFTAVLVTHTLEEAILLSDRVLVLSPRPARLLGELRVDIPHPRNDETMQSATFFRHIRALRRLLSSSGDQELPRRRKDE